MLQMQMRTFKIITAQYATGSEGFKGSEEGGSQPGGWGWRGKGGGQIQRGGRTGGGLSQQNLVEMPPLGRIA